MAETPAAISDIPAPATRRSLRSRLRALAGLRQSFMVDGVRYREVTSERLRHALSRQGPGSKEYHVAFPGGRSLRISCTPSRTFADLTGPRLLPVYRKAQSLLRPGMRVLVLEAGTGYAASWVASQVAPSGAVVSLERDHQSVVYAQRRYRHANVSFEHGGIEALAGETDGSFDAAMAVEALREGDEPVQVLRELWRVVAPSGWLMAACPANPWPPLRIRDQAPPIAMAETALLEKVAEAVMPPRPEEAVETEAQSGEESPPADQAKVSASPNITSLADGREGHCVAVALRPAE